jgi:hypothetical protein
MDDNPPVARQFTDTFAEMVQRDVDTADYVASPPFLRRANVEHERRHRPGQLSRDRVHAGVQVTGNAIEADPALGLAQPAKTGPVPVADLKRPNKVPGSWCLVLRGYLVPRPSCVSIDGSAPSTRNLAPTKNKELGTRHHVHQVPMATRLRSVRMYQRPSTSAGDASVYSPSRLT